ARKLSPPASSELKCLRGDELLLTSCACRCGLSAASFLLQPAGLDEERPARSRRRAPTRKASSASSKAWIWEERKARPGGGCFAAVQRSMARSKAAVGSSYNSSRQRPTERRGPPSRTARSRTLSSAAASAG